MIEQSVDLLKYFLDLLDLPTISIELQLSFVGFFLIFRFPEPVTFTWKDYELTFPTGTSDGFSHFCCLFWWNYSIN